MLLPALGASEDSTQNPATLRLCYLQFVDATERVPSEHRRKDRLV